MLMICTWLSASRIDPPQVLNTFAQPSSIKECKRKYSPEAHPKNNATEIQCHKEKLEKVLLAEKTLLNARKRTKYDKDHSPPEPTSGQPAKKSKAEITTTDIIIDYHNFYVYQDGMWLIHSSPKKSAHTTKMCGPIIIREDLSFDELIQYLGECLDLDPFYIPFSEDTYAISLPTRPW
jgi:DnaJ-class molecular chaperone